MAHGLEQPVMLVFSLGAVDDLRWGNGTEVFCELGNDVDSPLMHGNQLTSIWITSVSYTHLRAHETVLDLVCRLLLEKKKTPTTAPA